MENSVDKAAAGLLPVVREGFRAAWPICLGYFPIGLAFGVLAQKAGIGPLGVGLMSLLVFAGSAQFIAVSMLAQTAALTSIVLTTFLVNLRHLLMSSALSVYLRHSSWRFLCLFSHGITDESFAVNMTQFREGQLEPLRSSDGQPGFSCRMGWQHHRRSLRRPVHSGRGLRH